jgi:hypothetical protein
MKNHLLLAAIAASIFCISAAAGENMTVTVVDHPDLSAVNVNYVSTKAPLRPQCFIHLPAGSVRPQGWIGRTLELQRDGLNGHLNEISPWLDKKNNAWLVKDAGKVWEEVPYWLKGYIDLAYILNDKSMIAEAKTWIEGFLRTQCDDGSLGHMNAATTGKREMWAQMIVLWCFQSYYEHTGDARVIDAMTKYFKWEMSLPDEEFLKDDWGRYRAGDNLYSVMWLYDRTGDKSLLQLAEKLHRDGADWMQDTSLPTWHNVNIAQGFREPATYYMLTGDTAMLRATYNDFSLIRRTFGQMPGGMFAGDENSRIGYIDPRQCVETCGMVEQMSSDEMLLRFTGDTFWADNCEDVAFNSYPAALTPDLTALHYLTAPNLVACDVNNHAPGVQNAGPYLLMNPFSCRCCQHNHGQGWPYYAENLVLATPDNGVAVALYGACEADVKVGKKVVTLHEVTNYPFEENVKISVAVKGKVDFPFYLRIPSWTHGAEVTVNGSQVDVAPVSGKYYCISRTWKDGDVVEVKMPMSLSLRRWQVNKNSVSVNYGPLTLSLKIKENYEKADSRIYVIPDARFQSSADVNKWSAYQILPGSKWNYGLIIGEDNPFKDFKIVRKQWPTDNYPFVWDKTPIEFEATGRVIPSWTVDKTGLCNVLPDENVKMGEKETITLIPMGAARLRISAFPCAKDDK